MLQRFLKTQLSMTRFSSSTIKCSTYKHDERIFQLVDTHLHIYSLEARRSFPNFTEGTGSFMFPLKDYKFIYRTYLAKDIEASLLGSGVEAAVFEQCYNDSPEEVRWVQQEARTVDFIKVRE